ncbi:MFS general substrate transporter [Hyphopichia burtonii NRRL Y-1933]|uniref:MFS general substrate transporter n=1 Tax=Hyphopichia burtonii NRRL Y-1933 TaxID=984485 RepID=A0A1E4RD27_9ASCO|nr:MFS general substrate transporter [Hyphopichia burtonii NRRL Y-1933]ODV65151.1 MFS general substrate transporter [Hyphopichia burtonii NRRL Y-1933]
MASITSSLNEREVDKPTGLLDDCSKKNNNSSSIHSTSSDFDDNSTKLGFASTNDENSTRSLDSEPDFSDIDQKQLIKKLDFRLMPLFTILYLISFLDRGNIGAAKIEGLAEDLNLQGSEYNLCLTVFFIFYATLEIPSNILLNHVKPSALIVLAVILWGIVMTCTGLVQKYEDLLACRALLGIFEAPLFPGISFYLSVYYTKNEFLGALTILLGILAYFVFPDFPQDAKFLNDREREFVTYRVKHATNRDGESLKEVAKLGNDQRSAPLGEDHSKKPKYIWAAFSDWQCWAFLIMYYAVGVPLYGVSLFAPTIINNLGYTATKAQLLTAPIYIAAAVASIVQALILGKLGVRSPFILFNFLCTLTGYIILICMDPSTNPKSTYAALFITAFGIYPSFPIVVAWLSNNVAGTYKRAVAMGLEIGIGNLCGIFSSNIYRTQDSPRFFLGHGIEIMFVALGLMALVLTFFIYSGSNAKKKKRLQAGYYDDYSDDDILQMGDKSPYFLYRL